MNTAKHKKNYLLVTSLILALLGFVSKLIYRPWIIKNDLNDFKIHDFLPNLFYTIGICLIISYLTKKNQIKAMMFGTLGILIYETEQIWTNRTFDYLDVLATIVGFGISIIIFKKLTIKTP